MHVSVVLVVVVMGSYVDEAHAPFVEVAAEMVHQSSILLL